MLANPGHPEKISGTLLIANNDSDLAGGMAGDQTVGVLVFSVGVPGAEVEAYVSGNTIRNTTEPAIDVRRIVGRAYIERNVITTGSVAGLPAGPMAIRVVNTGSYLIAHNSIDCGWADGRAKGIGVYSQFAEWSMERAIVVDNDVTMSAPEGTVFGVDSAGIQVRGFAQSSVVQDNRIRGRASGDGWKAHAILRWRRVAGRRRQAITKLIKNDDESGDGIQSPTRSDQPLDVAVLRCELSWVENNVGFVGIEPSVGLVGELRVPENRAGLQQEVSQLKHPFPQLRRLVPSNDL
jgi:hypothetical protein